MTSRSRVAASIAVAAAVAVAIGVYRGRIRRSFEERHAKRFRLSPDGVVVGAEPFTLSGSPTHAVLLLHGFNDTPQSVAMFAAELHRAGYTVRAPLLPGHGRSLTAMASGRADQWLAHIRDEYDRLCGTHEHVMICGQSMGAALALLVASERENLPALVLLAPFIGLPRDVSIKFAAAWLPQVVMPYRRATGGERSIHDPDARAKALGAGVLTAGVLGQLKQLARRAERVLPAVTTPVLYVQSLEDNRIRQVDAERNFSRLGSSHREQRWLTGCGHIITADYCRDEVARQTTAWFTRWAGSPRHVFDETLTGK